MKKWFGLFLMPLLGLSLSSCGTSIGTYPDADKYLVGDQTYGENISSLDIDWVSGNLTLVEDRSIEGVKVEEKTDLTDEKERVHSYLNNGQLNIKFFASGYRRTSFTGFKKDLTVTYHPGITNIDIDLTSGNLKADSLTADKIDLEMTSGSSNVGRISAKEVDVDFTSGNLGIGHLSANTFDAEMTSGTIKVVFDEISKASFDLTSGSIDMTLPSAGGKVKVAKTSGSVNAVRQCSIENNLYTFGDGDADIKVEMTSGIVTIR